MRETNSFSCPKSKHLFRERTILFAFFINKDDVTHLNQLRQTVRGTKIAIDLSLKEKIILKMVFSVNQSPKRVVSFLQVKETKKQLLLYSRNKITFWILIYTEDLFSPCSKSIAKNRVVLRLKKRNIYSIKHFAKDFFWLISKRRPVCSLKCCKLGPLVFAHMQEGMCLFQTANSLEVSLLSQRPDALRYADSLL